MTDQGNDSHASVGDEIQAANGNWSFGGATPDMFNQHVAKSVPLYREGHELVVGLTDFFLTRGSTCYELGCSTGELIHKIALHNRRHDIDAVGIDVEPDMIAYAESHCTDGSVRFVAADIVDVALGPADVVVSYYTMQFVRPKYRQEVFNRIYEALNWGGALILFEKVRACDARFQDLISLMYADFKLSRGYAPDEILGKARSLKGVLEPFSTEANVQMMRRAGFEDVTSIMKFLCFEGFVAIK